MVRFQLGKECEKKRGAVDDFENFGLSNQKNRLFFYRNGKLGGGLGLGEFPTTLSLVCFSPTMFFFLVFVEYTRHALTSQSLHFLFLWLQGSCLRYSLGSFSQFSQNSVHMSLSQRPSQPCLKSHTPTFTTTFQLHSRHFFSLAFKKYLQNVSLYVQFIYST